MFFKKDKVEGNDYHNLDLDNIPKHIAFIMDGNGRWAKKRKMPRTYGHHEGTKTIRNIALKCNELKVEAMTVYAFSTENFARPEKEVQYIFKLPKDFFEAYMKELMENNVKICTIGHLDMAPQETQDIINTAIEKTKDNTGLKLCFAFIYGGRDEIVHAGKNIAIKLKEGLIKEDDINEQLFSNELMTKDLPDVDLMIRTSGEQRLSNFLLWQLAYAEFVFTNVLWPDFNDEELYKAIWLYQNRDRRFGGLK
ncbi:isoprenyl transferase [Thomasclavelia cocleata]|jgi:undecaprenyl diphosphate synthase|uniref:Isoprenyl transferase n=5 Tax=Thomasclavelia cocleata TaxID=69824 RepID=A0A829ZBP8_9FIRM|nr:isoprenyl transferase [Thomasclavelia cocleata]MCI9130398.1 isoprenyl transferase [Thomasclavelia cocleata]MCI9629295.1 isoprenyl transferase [Thomasclavelia cocleata]GFI41355.1 isoprenyl transferase [Thomasclavelia cocleata]